MKSIQMNYRSYKDPQAFQWEDKSVLITGGHGFIGRYLTNAIGKLHPKQLVVIDKSPSKPFSDFYLYYQLDLCNRNSVLDILNSFHFNLVYHLAGKVDQSVSIEVYQEQIRMSLETTLNLADALREMKIFKFVYIGSNAEYGNAPCPQSSESQERPNSAYGFAKLAASKFVLAKRYSEHFPSVVVRPYLVYGNGQSKNSFLSQAIYAAIDGDDFPTTPGEQTRDFVSVEKVVQDILHITTLPLEHGEIYNSCTGVEISIAEVLHLLKNIYPQFNPIFGAIDYRETELMQSYGIPLKPLDRDQSIGLLKKFFRSFDVNTL